MTYRVITPPGVENQILDQAFYIARDSIDHALQWEQKLQQRIETIGELPRSNPVSEKESQAAGYEIRKLVFGDYLIFYRIDDAIDTVYILAFMHGAQRRKQ